MKIDWNVASTKDDTLALVAEKYCSILKSVKIQYEDAVTVCEWSRELYTVSMMPSLREELTEEGRENILYLLEQATEFLEQVSRANIPKSELKAVEKFAENTLRRKRALEITFNEKPSGARTLKIREALSL